MARDDSFEADVNLQPESDVNAALLEERSAQRAARKPGARRLREKASALHEDLAAPGSDDNDPVEVVVRLDRQLVELVEGVELQPIVPLVARPAVERGSNGASNHRLAQAHVLSPALQLTTTCD